MAVVGAAAAKAAIAILVQAVREALKESLQLRGAKVLSLERATSRDTLLEPELQLNMCILSELFLQILATGLGALAIVWATVVLLGGFSTYLQRADFWVITAIVFIQGARVVGINLSPEVEFFNQVPLAFLELGAKQYATWGTRTSALKIVGIYTTMALLTILVLAVPVIAGLGCISLSIYRLVALPWIHQNNSNVLCALIFFYALVFLQGGLFIIWFFRRMKRTYIAEHVSLKYGFEDKRELIDKYMNKTLSTAIKNGVASAINRNLASFAADLMKSDYRQDHIDAVLVIHTLISKEVHRRRTLSQIQSSPLCVSRLLDMVNSKSRTDHRTKICIAEIVAHLASNLRLADISGATESISSMLDPYFTKISTPVTNVNIDHQTAIDITIDSKPLIIHGLLILAKLAVNPDNCKQIYDSKGLFSKITLLVKYKVYKIPSYDAITMDIAENALEVVSTLVSSTDETNGNIRRHICSNGIAVDDIRPIMGRDNRYNKLKVPATKILTELYLDMSTRATIGLDDTAEFIKVLLTIFLYDRNDSGLKKTAGKALAVLAMDDANCTTIMNFSTGTETSVVQLLTAMFPEANNRLYQTAIAQLLTQFSANSDSSAQRKCLNSVKTILHEVGLNKNIHLFSNNLLVLHKSLMPTSNSEYRSHLIIISHTYFLICITFFR
ncbi:unnamed protein product [Alopecurus aequalis]